MSYIALYREWRPKRFGDVIEQEHVVKALRYSVSTGRIAHAYLFCGTRGTGKTTMAHILSRAVNCLEPQDGEPCNRCEMCREILSGSCVDVLEIDAASNNSVDNVRAIRDEVIYTPAKARRKVYIIDEVHMLSTGAFNALLKTLEEPPEHVMFILATTEPHKLPATILSRCQRFDFRRISQDGIVKQLNKISSACGITLDEKAARLIARLSDGAMRDAISLLDQCASLGNKKIEYSDVLSVVGIVNDTFMAEFVDNMLSKKIPKILENISRLVEDGRDIAYFVSELVLFFRNLLICKSTNNECDNLVEVPDEILQIMKRQAGKITLDEIIRYIKELSALEYNLKWASNSRVLLEVAIIKLCSGSSHLDVSIADRLAALEKRLESGSPAPENSPVMPQAPLSPSARSPLSPPAMQEEKEEPGRPPLPEHQPAPENAAALEQPALPGRQPVKEQPLITENIEFESWPKIMQYLKDMGRMTLYSFLLNARALQLDENTIGLVIKEAPIRSNVSRVEHLKIIEEAAMKVTGRKIGIRCLNEENVKKVPTVAKAAANDPVVEKVRPIAEKNGLPLEILDE